MKLVGLKGRIPVEPLDDERLTNIERRIVTGASEIAPARAFHAPRFGWAMGLAVTAVVAVGAGFAGWALRGDAPPAVATAPVEVRTDANRATLDIGDATIASDPDSAFAITRPDGGVLVTMTRGKVELAVAKRAGRAPLVVAAGDTRVIVVGTRFSVDYGDGTGGVDVRVTEGVVKVERHQQTVRVAAGEAWTTERGVLALAAMPATRRSDATVAAADPTHVTAATGGAAADGTTADGTAGATIEARRGSGDLAIDIADAPEVLHERVATVPDTRLPTRGAGATRETTPRTSGTRGPEANLRSHTGAATAADGSLDLRGLILAQPLSPPLDVGEADPAKALSAYRMIAAKTTGDQASHAFYSVALLQHTRLGRNADALSTLDAYMRRFSGGREYRAALWLRVRILCTRAVDDRCRQAAHTYMRQATDTPAAKIAERLTLSPR